MKIICIGKNYAEHVKEMNSAIPKEPVFFMKPDTAVIKDGQPFYYPDFSKEVHHEVELILKINKPGKNIAVEFANKYYDEIGIGIDFTARDLQMQCKEKGLPWEKAKAFDGSAALGSFVDKKQFSTMNNINFYLTINGNMVQTGNTKDLLFSFDTVIAYVSKFITLKTGDLLYTGTPEGVGNVKIGDRLEGYIEDQKLLNFEIK